MPGGWSITLKTTTFLKPQGLKPKDMDLTSSHELIKYGTYSLMKWEPGFLKLKSIIDRVKIVLIPYAKLINRIWAIYKTKYLECPNFKTEFLNSLNYIPNIPSLINPFHATDLFWYPLKTSENLWFSVARDGLIVIEQFQTKTAISHITYFIPFTGIDISIQCMFAIFISFSNRFFTSLYQVFTLLVSINYKKIYLPEIQLKLKFPVNGFHQFGLKVTYI